MTTNLLNQLADHDIHKYGTAEQLKFEKHITRYFEREYEQWRGNKKPPEDYGVSSFEGEVAKKSTHAKHIDPYNKNFEIYKAFLDKEYMAYSMAYYGATADSPEVNADLSLEQAQAEKYKLIVDRADIRDGHNILELGCGFGGFIKYLLNTFPNVTVTGINPSDVQTRYIRNELSVDASRFNLIHQYLGDIRDDATQSESYDRVVSIGVLEHFTNFDLLFKHLNKILKPGGMCLHHIIVSIDTIPQFLNAESTLIANYFPGGHIWPFAEPARHNKHLEYKEGWFVNGMNYWKTLDEWHKRFWENIGQLYPEHLSIEEVEDWNKYFTLCKAMFVPNDGNSYGNGQFLYKKT